MHANNKLRSEAHKKFFRVREWAVRQCTYTLAILLLIMFQEKRFNFQRRERESERKEQRAESK